MTPQQIVAIAARLFAIWLVVISFQLLVVASSFRSQLGESSSLAVYFVPILPLLFAFFLWSFPMTMAHKLVPRSNEPNRLHIPAREVTAAASAVIGIWVLVGAIPQLLGRLGMAVASGEGQLIDMFFTPEHKLQLFVLGVQCILALFLLFKPWFVASKVFPQASSTIHGSE